MVAQGINSALKHVVSSFSQKDFRCHGDDPLQACTQSYPSASIAYDVVDLARTALVRSGNEVTSTGALYFRLNFPASMGACQCARDERLNRLSSHLKDMATTYLCHEDPNEPITDCVY